MNGLKDKWIGSQVRSGSRFEKSDGGGLTLTFRDGYTTPVWRLRYRIAGKPRVMILGSYGDLLRLTTSASVASYPAIRATV